MGSSSPCTWCILKRCSCHGTRLHCCKAASPQHAQSACSRVTSGSSWVSPGLDSLGEGRASPAGMGEGEPIFQPHQHCILPQPPTCPMSGQARRPQTLLALFSAYSSSELSLFLTLLDFCPLKGRLQSPQIAVLFCHQPRCWSWGICSPRVWSAGAAVAHTATSFYQQATPTPLPIPSPRRKKQLAQRTSFPLQQRSPSPPPGA